MAGRGHLEAACMHYQRAIQLQPDFAHFYYRLAVCEWGLGRIQAGEHLKQAVELNPQSTLAHAALAAWSLEHGRVEAAEQASKTALELSPEDNAAVQTRAQVLEVSATWILPGTSFSAWSSAVSSPCRSWSSMGVWPVTMTGNDKPWTS